MFALLAAAACNRTPPEKSRDPLTATERAWLKAHPVIRFAPDPDFPPVEYFSGNGSYSGITADYVALIARKLGIRFQIVRLRDWDEIIAKAKNRQIDVYVATKTPQRAEYMLFTRPFLEFPTVIIAREKVKGPIRMETLKGMRVSVVSQYAAHDFIAYSYPKLHLDQVPDVETGLRKVSFGLSDAFVENLATATYYIEKEGITNLRVAGDSGYAYRMGFCSRKDWPELNGILEKGVASLSIREKKAINEKWIALEPRSLLNSGKFQTGLLFAVAAILLSASGIFAWNRALARKVGRRTDELENELANRRRMEEELQHARDELEIRVEERTAELRHAKELLEEEISVRNRTERVITARLRLLEFAATHSLDDLLEATLDEAEELTGSSIGFFHFLDADQKTLSLQNWSTRTKAEFCTASGKGHQYEVSAAGVWVDCIHERRPVIHNDYASLQHRKGLPPGHPPVVRELVVPVFRGERIVAILGTGDKPLDYTPEDVDAVSMLADLAWEITERKRLEEELLLSRFCIDKAGIGIFQSDETGVIFNVNDHACKSLGYSRDELCALSVFDIDPEITREKMAKLGTILGEQGSVTHETTHRRRDGTTFPVEITANLLDFRGKTYGISFVKDITERKRTEEALREAGLVMENSPAVLFRWKGDDEWPVELVSGNIEQFGYTPDDFLSGALTYSSVIHPDDLERITREVHDYCDGGADQFRLEYRIVTRKGDARWVNEHTHVERDASGAVSKFEGIVIDVTERKLAEDSIRESRAKYQAIVDSFDGLIYICSKDLRIEFMNRKLIERTGRDAVGEYCYKVMHDRDSICPWCVNDRVFAGEIFHRDMFSPKDRRWYEVLNVPIRHADGSMSKHSMMVDITDRKLFEEELKRQKQLLQELNETLENRVEEEVAKNREKDIMLIQQNRQAALGEMLDHIAHQWKQPLNSISIIIQALEEAASVGELSDELIGETAGRVTALVEHMAQTIDVFRGFYRPDKEKKVFGIKDAIDRALAFIAPALSVQSIAVELDVDPGLTGFGYPKEYTQVLLNILANARDVFRSRGTEQPRVAIRAFAEVRKSVVTITDNGGGIPDAIKDRIFDFYFTTSESSGGTGIGLYMSRNIIEKNMGGTLSAGNADGGARFRIEIPPA